jgi:hypothetical protein
MSGIETKGRSASSHDANEMPAYDGQGKAAEVFGHPYYYDGDSDQANEYAPIRQFVFGDLTVGELSYCRNANHPDYDNDAAAVDFFSHHHFYKGNRAMADLYALIRQEKFGTRTVGEVIQRLPSTKAYVECFQSVGIWRAAVGCYASVPPSDDFGYVPSSGGDEAAKDFFAHRYFYYGNQFAADAYAFVRNQHFGDKSVFEVTGPCESYEDLRRVFGKVGIDIGIQIIQYHPKYANIFSSSFFRAANLADEVTADK